MMKSLFSRWLVAGMCLATAMPVIAQSKADTESGRELFVREWLPNDTRSKSGDGLGPVFNDTSCVACHNQGGVGGAGPNGKNVDVVTPFSSGMESAPANSLVGAIVQLIAGTANTVAPGEKLTDKEKEKKRLAKVRAQRDRLAKHHPGFKTARSVVLHHFGTEPKFASWRAKLAGHGFHAFNDMVGNATSHATNQISQLQSQVQSQQFHFGPVHSGGEFIFVVSERNPIALFGSGLIDQVSDEDMLAAAGKKYKEFPLITGRAARLKNGKIGRFGWKAQKASLHDFVLTACSTELGLEVPGNPQAGSPTKPKYVAPGLDLTEQQCRQLTSYIAALPAPKPRSSKIELEKKTIASGRELFVKVGCAACHTEDMGEAKGIYSDLLLHDMGPELGDTGEYGSFTPNSTDEEEFTELVPSFEGGSSFFGVGMAQPKVKRMSPEKEAKLVGALRLEWRTPPLWGVRDSAPYLHDGRAQSLEQAIALHGGEAQKVRQNYFKLTPAQRLQVQTFLKSLVAP